jgi:probable rRNA maturation factor
MAPKIELDVDYLCPDVAEDTERYMQAAAWVASRAGVETLVVGVAIVDDETIQQVNRQRLEHDWPTDVISFLLDRDRTLVEGEVIASATTARRVSSSVGWSASDELLLYVVHGLLHIVGYDDISVEQQLEMRGLEQACLLSLGIEAAGQHIQRWEEFNN